MAATRLVLILRLLLLAFEERIDVANLQLAHAISLRNQLIHPLLVRLEGLDESRVRPARDALQFGLEGRVDGAEILLILLDCVNEDPTLFADEPPLDVKCHPAV